MRAVLLSIALYFLTLPAIFAQDSSASIQKLSPKDSIKVLADTILKSGRLLLENRANEIWKKSKNLSQINVSKSLLTNTIPKDSATIVAFKNPFKDFLSHRPIFGVSDGFVAYHFNYRSNIDTPFLEREIAQHNLTGRMNLMVAGNLPFSFSFWLRRTNSGLFRDINDVQLAFNTNEFRNKAHSAMRNVLLNRVNELRDSLSEKLLAIKSQHLNEIDQWLKHPLQLQSLIECNEILNVPKITYSPDLPDSVNRKRSDSLQNLAKVFMDLYLETEKESERLKHEIDSVRKVVNESITRMRQFKNMIQNGGLAGQSVTEWTSMMKQYGMKQLSIPSKYKWLMGIRQLIVGRGVVNYSDLTAKNISVSGLNFEYNSWYYFALSAGMVDYRFRDFVTNPFKKTPQYLFLARAGFGRLESSNVIGTVYRGQKQLFVGSNNTSGLTSITITGVSFETKWRINKTNWISAEVSQSVSPDFRNNPAQSDSKFNFSDETNKAWAIRISSWQPKTNSLFEGMYKYTGANFQSFSSFQTNAGQKAWYLKAEQYFWKKQIRLNASLRNNDYFNPFVQQQYSSNTIFKTVTVTLRKRRWPTVTVGYQPMVQYTKLDNVLMENRFQSLSASVYYLYKLRNRQVATTVVYNKYYNSTVDTGFIYFDAVNLYANQNFFFRHFNANAGISYTRNSNYELVLLEGSFQRNFQRLGHIGFGVKINTHNKSLTKVGGFINAGIKITRQDILSIHAERGWLPGFSNSLVQNDIGSIQFTKTFRFR